jgi:nucleoside-diphosphate-sugar epimerase
MSHRILITGASGYLGGTLLARWKDARLPTYSKLYALVRTDDQAAAVKQYDAEPITVNLEDNNSIAKAITDNQITIVYYLFDAWGKTIIPFIEALAEVKKSTGSDVHFLFTTGAKMFSSHAGAPTDNPLLDTDSDMYDLQKRQKGQPLVQEAIDANTRVIDAAEVLGVRSYIFVPCIVYGKGEGFGNPMSIQTVAIVQAARKVRGVYKVDEGRPSWPVCHVVDNAMLYVEILRGILEGKDIGHGKNGFYLASSGGITWDELYAAMAIALKKRGIVDDDNIKKADDAIMEEMGEALGCPGFAVPIQLGGK